MTGDDRVRSELESLERAAPTGLPPRPPLPGRPSRLRLLAPAAVMLAAGLVIGFGLIAWLDDIRPLGSAPPSETGVGSGSPVASPSTPVGELTWTTRPFPDPDSQLVPRHITEVDGRLIVTGGSDTAPAAWFSDDGGGIWTRASIIGPQPEGASTGDRPMGPIADFDGRLLSISEPGGQPPTEAWVSIDRGETWARSAAPPRLLIDLVAGPTGYVAVGVAGAGSQDEAAIAGGPSGSIRDALTLEAHIGVWTSVDGRTWQRAEDHPSFASAFATDLVADNGRFVAVGAKAPGEAAMWASADGATWEPVELPAGHVQIMAAAAGPLGFVAVSDIDASDASATLWRSGDGHDWTAEPLVLETEALADIAVDPQSVFAGSHGIVVTGHAPAVRHGSSFTWLVAPNANPVLLDAVNFVVDVTAIRDGFVGLRVCPAVLCDEVSSIVFALPGGTSVPDPMMATPTDAPWRLDCGAVDGDLCERTLEAVFAKYLNPGDEPVASIALGEGICLDGSCPFLPEVEDAIGVTVVYRERPFPLHLNCHVREGEPVPVCIAAARTLVGEPGIGVPYAVTIFTHCGLRAVEFDGDRWAIDGPLEGHLGGNPPDGFGNPQDHGTVTLVSPDEGIYLSEGGVERRIARGGALPPVEGCI